jgi:hypothetical protein
LESHFNAIVVLASLLGILCCAAPVLATPAAAVPLREVAIEKRADNRPEAAKELGNWVNKHPQAARKFFMWDSTHPERSKIFVTWAITHPDRCLRGTASRLAVF